MNNHVNDLESGTQLILDFEKIVKIGKSEIKVIPLVIQDHLTKEVLIVGYTNQEALTHTLTTKEVALWSTSRNELWIKGATSGDGLTLVEARVNCEQNSILYLVEVAGRGVCHTQNKLSVPRGTCYYRKVDTQGLTFLCELE